VNQVELLIQNLPKAKAGELISFIAEQLEVSTEVGFLVSWLKPLLLFHSDALSSSDLEVVSNLKNTIKNLKRRIDSIVGM
jgi:Dip2/Utp12 Family